MPVENYWLDAVGQLENSWGSHRELHLIGQLKITLGIPQSFTLLRIENFLPDAIGQLENS